VITSRFARLASFLVLALPAAAQAGDQPGEEQPQLPDDLEVPAAPVLSPEEALASFALEPGFEIQLVAAEPLVEDPVAIAFDGDGGLWVCEMRGFMPDIDGTNEDAPVGSIVRLRDTDGDGRMDERTVFLDQLVLPRAIAPAYDGLLVIAPPDLFFARDTDGDGRADERVLIDTDLGGIHSPEHAINGLIYTADNWYRCANSKTRYRRVDGEWVIGKTAGGGQWGITKDTWGRIFYDTNSDPLRGDLFASHYAVRNPTHGQAGGVNVRIAEEMRVWPARITPGVNRGYRKATLKPDLTLARFTAACGPLIYRGHAFPLTFRGNAFVCEPAANLIKRYVFEPADGIRLRAVDAGMTRSRKLDFLTSTDERFRPVNLADGPDGAMYVVDMYRGVIQHKIFVTTFLRRQVVDRGLDAPVGLGRIWRIVSRTMPRTKAPAMSSASWTELVEALSHPAGWWRDTAQRILVEEGVDSKDARELLREAWRSAPADLGRVHALWALDGIGALTEDLVRDALRDRSGQVRHTAVRLSERFIASGSSELLPLLMELGRSPDPRMRHQVFLSLGEGETDATDAAMAQLVTEDVAGPEVRAAVMCGLYQRELAFLERLLALPGWEESKPGRVPLLEVLARNVTREGRSDRVEELLGVLASCEEWQQGPIGRGLLDGRAPTAKGEKGPIRLSREPPVLAELVAMKQADALVRVLAWPGGPGYEEEEVRELTAKEKARFVHGREVYASVCASCHQFSGLGEGGKAPSLRFSPWVLGSEERLARVLLQGMQGPVEIDGQVWDAEMPALVASDEDIAAVLTYVRREWGHGADPVDAETVQRIREVIAEHGAPWTVQELEALD